MLRSEMVAQVADSKTVWDIIVIGGGATGLGTAVEAASRGYRTLLLEQLDFSQGTSSRSTKLIHGGVRYLQQGNLTLVLESLHERGLLLQNAPHLVHHQAFIVPNYEWWEGPFYGIGLKLYDALAGKLGFGPSRHLTREETIEKIPTVSPEGLRGGAIYYDGQFDDARLAITLARTLADLGGCAVNYMPVNGFINEGGMTCGVLTRDNETGQDYEIKSKVVVNATGIFVDRLRRLEDPSIEPVISPSQGIHLVLGKTFLPGEAAIMVPHTDDGRVLFAVPWHDRVIVGTTDTELKDVSVEPTPFPEEIDFLLLHAKRYLTGHPTVKDVCSVFAGIRPLIQGQSQQQTASLSRDHQIMVSPAGLVSIAGGKWTTYRKMGEDTMNIAAKVGGLEERSSCTDHLRLHGWMEEIDLTGSYAVYGADGDAIKQLTHEDPALNILLHGSFPYRLVEIVWAVRYEMARSLLDVLARRLRCLFLDARASVAVAPKVAALMAKELGKSKAWEKEQVALFKKVAKSYIL
jgi:glycerol-3-phosphate dehydrogenase